MSHDRNIKYLTDRRIIYRRFPINDQPTERFEWGDYYETGTNECYELFRSKAKINTYRSLKWHLLVIWYLNPQLDQDKLESLCRFICDKSNNFITFNISDQVLKTILYEVSMHDLESPPKNKIRKTPNRSVKTPPINAPTKVMMTPNTLLTAATSSLV